MKNEALLNEELHPKLVKVVLGSLAYAVPILSIDGTKVETASRRIEK